MTKQQKNALKLCIEAFKQGGLKSKVVDTFVYTKQFHPVGSQTSSEGGVNKSSSYHLGTMGSIVMGVLQPGRRPASQSRGRAEAHCQGFRGWRAGINTPFPAIYTQPDLFSQLFL